jgi:hypothetical protein
MNETKPSTKAPTPRKQAQAGFAVVVLALLACKGGKQESDAAIVVAPDDVGRACRFHNQRRPAGNIAVFDSYETLKGARDSINAYDDRASADETVRSHAFVVGAHEHCVIVSTAYMDFSTAREVMVKTGQHSGKRGWVFHNWALTEKEWSQAGLTAPFDSGVGAHRQ